MYRCNKVEMMYLIIITVSSFGNVWYTNLLLYNINIFSNNMIIIRSCSNLTESTCFTISKNKTNLSTEF